MYCFTWASVIWSFATIISAPTDAATGHDALVPLKNVLSPVLYPSAPVMSVVAILLPGAESDMPGPKLENEDLASLLVVLPTAITPA